MMILFDTDTMSEYFFGDENVTRRMAVVGIDELCTTIITRFEVFRGRTENLLKAADAIELRRAVERFRKTEEVFAQFRLVDIDETVIGHFERLLKQKSLKKIGRADLLIACIALANDALLVTRNVKDFNKINGLRIENWVD